MIEIQVVGFYVGVNILLMLFLVVNVVQYCCCIFISLGIGMDVGFEQVVWVQVNCLENVVLGLFVFILLVLIGVLLLILYGFGVVLMFG